MFALDIALQDIVKCRHVRIAFKWSVQNVAFEGSVQNMSSQIDRTYVLSKGLQYLDLRWDFETRRDWLGLPVSVVSIVLVLVFFMPFLYISDLPTLSLPPLLSRRKAPPFNQFLCARNFSPLKETLETFSIVHFLGNYDVMKRKQ